MKTPAHYFRANVAMLVISEGKVLACQRQDFQDSWQCPQGGIDVGETPIQAAWRELQEETSLTQDIVELVAECPYWVSYTYDFPSPFGDCVGQTQRWFVFRLIGAADAIMLDPEEFQAWRWSNLGEIADSLPLMKQDSFAQIRSWVEPLLVDV